MLKKEKFCNELFSSFKPFLKCFLTGKILSVIFFADTPCMCEYPDTAQPAQSGVTNSELDILLFIAS